MRVIIDPSAKADIGTITLWYKNIHPALYKKFRHFLRDIFQQISRYPESFSVMNKGLHRAVLPDFPYAVFYIIDNGEIHILAVIHTSRNPEIWQQREH